MLFEQQANELLNEEIIAVMSLLASKGAVKRNHKIINYEVINVPISNTKPR